MHILQSEFKAKKNDRKPGTIKFGKQVNMVTYLWRKKEIFVGEYISPIGCPISCTLQ